MCYVTLFKYFSATFDEGWGVCWLFISRVLDVYKRQLVESNITCMNKKRG